MTSPSPTSDPAKPSTQDLSALSSSLSAEACDRIVQMIRGKAEETIAHLQQDVFRLIDQAGPAASEPPQTAAGQDVFRTQAGQPRPAWDSGEPWHREPEPVGGERPSIDRQGAIRQAVRLEIERLNIAEIVGEEVKRQMRSFAEQLQEQINRKNPRTLKNAGPFSGRQRR